MSSDHTPPPAPSATRSMPPFPPPRGPRASSSRSGTLASCMGMTLYTTVPSPVGELMLCGDEQALTALHLPGRWPKPAAGWRRDDARFADVASQLEQYFSGERTTFDVPLTLRGGPSEREVWAELRRIPYGETASYGQRARRLGRPFAARAVGAA